MKTVYLTGVNGSLELKTYTACYGILGLQNFLQPSCPGGQKIAVRAVYSMAKYKSSGCPQEQTPANNSATCCVFDQDDCSYLYDSGSYRSYYQVCNGKTSCLIQVSWIQTPASCNRSLYIERTHYMKMDYYCISGSCYFNYLSRWTFYWNGIFLFIMYQPSLLIQVFYELIYKNKNEGYSCFYLKKIRIVISFHFISCNEIFHASLIFNL